MPMVRDGGWRQEAAKTIEVDKSPGEELELAKTAGGCDELATQLAGRARGSSELANASRRRMLAEAELARAQLAGASERRKLADAELAKAGEQLAGTSRRRKLAKAALARAQPAGASRRRKLEKAELVDTSALEPGWFERQSRDREPEPRNLRGWGGMEDKAQQEMRAEGKT